MKSDEYLKILQLIMVSSSILHKIFLIFIVRLMNVFFSVNHIFSNDFNPQTPVTQKVADEVVFRRFRGELFSYFQFFYLTCKTRAGFSKISKLHASTRARAENLQI